MNDGKADRPIYGGPEKIMHKIASTSALAFIILMGFVSMFSDMTHEGASSILGAYLSLLGASAATIGFVSGLGELAGYSLRLVTGYIADKTKNYWSLTLLGYIIDVFAVPLLALVPENGWMYACALIILERSGKAIKKPAKDTLLSFAASQVGAGKSFALQEALDQLGAFLGPVLLFAALMLKKGSVPVTEYRLCFALLFIPAVLTIALLIFAWRKFPDPENFEAPAATGTPFKISAPFLWYIAATCIFAFGFLDFNMITMHVSREQLVAPDYLPLLYAAAMFTDAVAAVIFGWMYDKYGLKVLILSTLVAAPFSILIFNFTNLYVVIAGILLWGVGMGAQESVFKAAVTSIVPKETRSSGFGISQTAFGICWFLGSWALGWLYDQNLNAMVLASTVTQLLSLPCFYLAAQKFTGTSTQK